MKLRVYEEKYGRSESDSIEEEDEQLPELDLPVWLPAYVRVAAYAEARGGCKIANRGGDLRVWFCVRLCSCLPSSPSRFLKCSYQSSWHGLIRPPETASEELIPQERRPPIPATPKGWKALQSRDALMDCSGPNQLAACEIVHCVRGWMILESVLERPCGLWALGPFG